MKGAVPTPAGNINLYVSEKKITVETIVGKGLLRFHSAKKPVCKTGIIRSIASGYYELEMEARQTYEVGYSAKH
jgi:hypothetical protein